MDYKNNYDDLINNAKSRAAEKDGYYEMHHIVPRSLGGSNSKENLVRLTAREHYIAHYLLWKMTGSREMAFAFWRMNFQKNKLSKNGVKRLSSRMYEKLRKEVSDDMKASSKKRPVYCLELDREFDSATSGAVFISGNKKRSGDIISVCSGKLKTCFRYKGQYLHWCYAENKNDMIKNKEALIYESYNLKKTAYEKQSATMKEKYSNGDLVSHSKGMRKTQEEKDRQSATMKEKYSNGELLSCFKGRRLTEQEKKNLSDKAHERYSNGFIPPFKGKHLSEETKEKLRKSRSKPVYCIELDILFPSGKTAALYLSKTSTWGSYITSACNGKHEYAGTLNGKKLHWKYIECNI
jgi:hypothetical protein